MTSILDKEGTRLVQEQQLLDLKSLERVTGSVPSRKIAGAGTLVANCGMS